ncbi:Alternative cyclin pcl1 [Mycena venus]|uniref:Alternative cyclin pcl1 n=1 Tax=Mycena venus TaxID=2733690 RepID=A0A8H7DI71_9AGAR|nr:Alternative cyclin pcl1 [Mycena venus]
MFSFVDSPSSPSCGSVERSSLSSPRSTHSSPVHAASLVDPARHSPALMHLIDIELSQPVIEYVVDCVSETVDHAMGRTPCSSRRRTPTAQKFIGFVSTVLLRAEEYALERTFLGALIVASKYTNDNTLKNVHWALCTGVFGKRDIGRIEYEFLDVLDWELGVTEEDLLAYHAGFATAALSGHEMQRSSSRPRRVERVRGR